MTAEELQSEAAQQFEAAGLAKDFVAGRSQFLEGPEGLFAEIVVRDGAKLEEFRRIAEKLRAASGEPVTYIVRAVWEVEKVGDPQTAYSMQTGTPKTSVQFPVDLRSGSVAQRAWVELTYLAGSVFDENGVDNEGAKRIIGEFVREQLRKGGMSYWDPIRSPQLEINANTASFILGRALEVLKRPAV